MRNGSGKIYNKTSIKQQNNCLEQLTNKPFTKSQVLCDKTQRITQLDSNSSKSNSRTKNIQHNEQNSIHNHNNNNNNLDDSLSIVRKLTSLNTIFKQLKMLKEKQQSYQIIKSISKIQDKFIHLQRQILKAAHFQNTN